MSKVSVIIPARNEIYLQNTITEVLSKASGDIEVIAILDGYWPDPVLKEDPRLILIHRERHGMRAAINAGVAIARGEYLMKLDAHCLIAPGFDETLQKDCDKDWIVIPRRYSVEMDTWEIRKHRPFIDYEYLSYPFRPKQRKGDQQMCGMVWDERITNRIDTLLDETMTWQGSCWFMPREFFNRRIGAMDEAGYGTFICEAQELGLKVWLGGGKVMVNKNTWFAHLWKGEPYRKKYMELFGKVYSRVGLNERKQGNKFNIQYWLGNQWPERIHDLSWLIDKFWPVPSWPNEREKWTL